MCTTPEGRKTPHNNAHRLCRQAGKTAGVSPQRHRVPGRSRAGRVLGAVLRGLLRTGVRSCDREESARGRSELPGAGGLAVSQQKQQITLQDVPPKGHAEAETQG